MTATSHHREVELSADATPQPALPWWAAVLVATYVNAGDWKDSPLLAVSPLDVTLLLALVLSAVVTWRVVMDGLPFAAVIVLSGLALLVPPLMWTLSSPYADEKATRFFTLTVLSALAPAILIRSLGDVRRLLAAYAAISLLTVVYVLIDPQPVAKYKGSPLALPGVSTIAVGQAAGFVILFAALALIWKERGSVLWAPVVAGASIFVMLETGSRGPLLAVAAAVVFTLIVLQPPALRTVITIGMAVLAVAVLFARAPLYARHRIESAAHGQVTGTVLIRVHLFETAERSIAQHPFGVGWGGYARIAPGGYLYPHDLALEVLTEAGVLFGGLFLAWILLYYCWLPRARGGFPRSILFATLTFALFGAATSGDLNDDRTVFMLLGTAIAVVHARRPGLVQT